MSDRPHASKGRKLSMEHRAKLSAAKFGRRYSFEHREKISEGVKRAWENGKMARRRNKYSLTPEEADVYRLFRKKGYSKQEAFAAARGEQEGTLL